MRTYPVQVVRDSGFRILEIPELRAVGQARTRWSPDPRCWPAWASVSDAGEMLDRRNCPQRS